MDIGYHLHATYTYYLVEYNNNHNEYRLSLKIFNTFILICEIQIQEFWLSHKRFIIISFKYMKNANKGTLVKESNGK